MQDSYREIFFAETQEYLSTISQCLVKLEDDPSDLSSLNEIFRAIHTIKGMSATMGFEKLTQLSHQMEDLLDGLRSEKIRLNSQITDGLFNCLDFLEALVEDLKTKKESKIDISSCLGILKKFISGEEETEGVAKQISEVIEFTDSERKKINDKNNEGFNIFKIKVMLADDCAMKQVRAFLVITNLGKMGEIIKCLPTVEELKKGWFSIPFFVVVIASKEVEQVMRQEILDTSEIKDVKIERLQASREKQKTMVQVGAPSYIKKIQSLRIPVSRLDKIMNLMGELSIAKIRLLQTVQQNKIKSLEEVAFNVDHLTTVLQDEIIQTRLIPTSYILDTFPRITRDLARSQNKDIELEITGSEIELDRTILDEIGDSLVHLVRNAIDHGIETPQKRTQMRKNSKGRILIKVTRQKGHISIEVIDNGGGIDFEAVCRSALKKGLVTKEEVSELSKNKDAVLNLLTLPGFSTSDKVSDISGRGVGLDVVKLKMDALGGDLNFETKSGEGTRFILTLPLTLAIIKAMLVKVGSEIFAIDLMNIRETIKIEKEEIKLINNFEVIRVRDEIIPILRLDKALQLQTLDQATREKESQNSKLSIVIIESEAKGIGFMVDEVLGEQDIVVKPLGSMVKGIKGIAGATIIGDGKVALILDVIRLSKPG